MNNKKREISQATVNKILSITIAIFLWLFVIGGENPVKDKTISGVPVTLKNLETLADDNLAIAGSTSYTVDVKLKGQRTVVDPLTAADIEVEADLFGYGIGKNYINVTAVIPDNTELIEIRSPKIEVNIEELVAVSKPVNINFTNVPEGKEVGGLSIQPLEVEVSGAQSLVGSVAWAFGTVSVSEYTPEQVNTVQAELQPLNDGEALVNNVRMSSQYADMSYVIMDVKEVPLIVEKTYAPMGDVVVEEITAPETIKIRGLAAALETVESIAVEPVDPEILMPDENGIAETGLTPILPEGIELSRTNPQLKAELKYKQVATETLEYGGTDIEVRNMPETVAAEVAANMYTVTIYGEEAAIEAFEKESVTLYVDGADLEIGEEGLTEGLVQMRIHVEYGSELNYVRVVPEEAVVQIRLTGEE